MRVEYDTIDQRFHAVVVVDDDGNKWRTDVKVLGDVTADDGRGLVYRGSAIRGILPKTALEAVLIGEFKRSGAQRDDDWLRVSVFLASFVLTAAVAFHFCFDNAAAPVDLPGHVQVDVGVAI